MALQLDANVNILWQNLIALNASLNHENQERREELLQTKKLLEGETAKSRALLEQNKAQEHEISKKDRKIAQLNLKMDAVKRIIISQESEDDHIDNVGATLPVIVKVESVEANANTINTTPVNDDKSSVTLIQIPRRRANACTICGKQLANKNVKRHMALHSEPSIPCPMCTLKFVRADYVQRHLRKVHNGVSTSVSTGSRPSRK